jgi:transposase
MERSTIHLLHKRGQSQREIARELGRSRATVARALAEPVDQPPPRRHRAKLTDPYRERIAGWVKEGLTAVRMFELARDDPEQPYAGQLSVFRAAVRRERQGQAQSQAIDVVSVRFAGLAGEYLQVDWGEIRHFPFTQQEPATRYFLACRLKYSRWTWVRFTTEMRQETLFRGLVDCVLALGWVPWVLVFDNMKTVTTGRDAQQQPIWHPALLQLAAEFDFHPEACWPGAGNQKGSVESLVKWVKGNFLAGRVFADDADLGAQCEMWLTYANTRPSQATDVAPLARLVEEATKGGPLPMSAADYGFAHPGQVSSGALVAVLGNSYSVPIAQVGAPVTVRVHRERIVIWRDAEWLAEHARAPDGAHRRVVDLAHFAPLFGRKPRAQVMLYREALLELGPVAASYVGEVSRRQRARLGDEILGLYALYECHGAGALLAAMAVATAQGAYGVAYLQALIAPPSPAREVITPLAPPTGLQPSLLALADLPPQAEVDRALSPYESYVWIPDRVDGRVAALATLGEVLP